MSVGLGHQTLVAIGEQSTFGTSVTRTLGLRVKKYGIKRTQPISQKEVLGHSSKHINIAGKAVVEGPVSLYLPPEGAAVKMLLKNAFGSISSPAGTLMDDAVTTKTTHTFSLTDSLPDAGLSFELDPDSSATGFALLHDSCKANKFTLNQSLDDGLILDMDFLGREETEVSATGGLVYQALKTFDWDELVVSLAGTELLVESLELSVENSLDGDSHKMGSVLRRNIKRKSTRSVSGKLTCEMDSDDVMDFYRALTENTLTAVWTGPQIGLISAVAQYRTFTLSFPRIVLQGAFNDVSGPGRIMLDVPFICSPTLDTDASEVTAVLVNTTA